MVLNDDDVRALRNGPSYVTTFSYPSQGCRRQAGGDKLTFNEYLRKLALTRLVSWFLIEAQSLLFPLGEELISILFVYTLKQSFKCFGVFWFFFYVSSQLYNILTFFFKANQTSMSLLRTIQPLQ